jgi:inner membrane protein
MLGKTHLVIALFATIIFLPHVSHKWAFIPIVLLATMLPDVDSGFSSVGKKPIFRPLRVLTRHRGLFHSFTFCILATLALTLYWPVLAFPFFLGYGLHLLADSWTPEGIKPFWPLKLVSRGNIKVGGTIENTLFLVFVLMDVLFAILLFA